MEPKTVTDRRLVRRSEGRFIAGVCKGIADHFALDPALVRIAFVALTLLGGAGVVAYAAAWAIIPEEGGGPSFGERLVREHRWGRIAGVALIVVAVSTLVRPLWWFGGHALLPVLLIVGGLYLLSPGFRNDDGWPSAPPPPPPPPPPAADAPGDDMPPPPPDVTMPLPVHGPTPGGRRRRRGGLAALTFGLLFIGAGAIGIVIAAGGTIEPTYVFAIGLLVIGAALVLSTWFGRSFVLIPLGLLMTGLLSVSAVIDVPITGGVGERTERPLTVTDLEEEYHLGMGELQLDLTRVDFDRGTVHTVKATVGLGHLLVRVPRDVVVEIQGRAGLGEVRILDDRDGGVRVDRDTTLPAAGENPPRIVLDLEVGAGQVEVVDAAS